MHNENEINEISNSNISTLNENVDELTGSIPVSMQDIYSNTKLKRNLEIKYICEDGMDWIKGKVISRAGKSTGMYASDWNAETGGCVKVLDFDKDVKKWIKDENVTADDEICFNEVFTAQINQEMEQAKKAELQNWLQEDVYEEVDDCNQRYISVRWVLSKKLTGEEWKTKARLVARGYEENQDNIGTDSAT